MYSSADTVMKFKIICVGFHNTFFSSTGLLGWAVVGSSGGKPNFLLLSAYMI
jgi:hypothetical protein